MSTPFKINDITNEEVSKFILGYSTLILGASGSGKTWILYDIIEKCKQHVGEYMLVCSQNTILQYVNEENDASLTDTKSMYIFDRNKVQCEYDLNQNIIKDIFDKQEQKTKAFKHRNTPILIKRMITNLYKYHPNKTNASKNELVIIRDLINVLKSINKINNVTEDKLKELESTSYRSISERKSSEKLRETLLSNEKMSIVEIFKKFVKTCMDRNFRQYNLLDYLNSLIQMYETAYNIACKSRDKLDALKNIKEIVDNLHLYAEVILNFDKSPELVIIIDDCTSSLKTWANIKFTKSGSTSTGGFRELFKELFYQGRHIHVSIIILAHNMTSIEKSIRSNIFNVIATNQVSFNSVIDTSSAMNAVTINQNQALCSSVFNQVSNDEGRKDYKLFIKVKDDQCYRYLADDFAQSNISRPNNRPVINKWVYSVCQLDNSKATTDDL